MISTLMQWPLEKQETLEALAVEHNLLDWVSSMLRDRFWTTSKSLKDLAFKLDWREKPLLFRVSVTLVTGLRSSLLRQELNSSELLNLMEAFTTRRESIQTTLTNIKKDLKQKEWKATPVLNPLMTSQPFTSPVIFSFRQLLKNQ